MPIGESVTPHGDLSPGLRTLQPSLIRQLSNEAMSGRDETDIIPLWFGEPDRPTPDFVRRAGQRALAEGRTFYTPNAGLPELRVALANYMNRLYGTSFGARNILVTGSGMLAITLAGKCIVAPGDHVVIHAPAWPNLPGVQQLLGARITRVPLDLDADRWSLDLERLFAACAPGTRALLLNSPNNPTGWMLDDEEQHAILAHCRRHGIWLIADEVYNRIIYDRSHAPSFADKICEEDRALIINSFSKTWAMTGWRLGWLTAPAQLLDTLEMLTEFTNSCSPAATQLAGVVALREGEPFLRESLKRWRRSRDLMRDALAELPRSRWPLPQAAFYAFFGLEGVADSYAFAARALCEASVGLAPGVAFGPEGEGWLRLCHAVEPALMTRALERLRPLLA